MHVGYDLVSLVAAYTAVAAALDYRTRKIPNWLTVPAAVLGLAYHTLAPGGIGPLASLAGLAIGFALLLLPWILGGGGMGDVKLLAALGAWLGPTLILITFGLATVLAAFAAVTILTASAVSHGYSATRRRYATVTAGTAAAAAAAPSIPAPQKKRRVLPFAVPVAAGTWLVLAWLLLRSMTA